MELKEKEKIAEKTREYRFRNRLSQKELAERCGLNQCQISFFESGDFRRISDENVLKVAKVVGVLFHTKNTKESQRTQRGV